ncbi:hypothetical protein PVK06_001998 [Gossypium arboreum]|uniref:Uncharacterized protein n=1 Tax=Gossypium arboreum TaxID=29729 RepID=A0ABR0R2L7_GOSAR|nr:hypothetical protein PVK06_001998 [Gossypium arboreum]
MKKNERKKNEIEFEKECEQETQIEKEKEIEVRNKSVKETSVVVSQGSFDKFQLHYLPKERLFKLIKEGKNESDIIPQVPKGDDVRWYPLKKGGSANNLICYLENFLSSKWPDLRTNHLQEGGYDAIPVASCFDTSR